MSLPAPIRPYPMAALAAALALAGCGGPQLEPLPLGEAQVTRLHASAPPGAALGTCWGRDSSPAVVETVTEQVIVQPAQVTASGAVAHPAIYRTETRQRIVREREDVWFRTPCASDLTEDFTRSLQRALTARGLYDGSVTGRMDTATRAAIRAYQRPEGLDSGVLSLAAARKLGLSVVDVPGAGPETVPVGAPAAE